MLNFIGRTLPSFPQRGELREAFSRLKSTLTELSEDPFEKKAMEGFDWIPWLESKITGRSFAEIIKEKASGDK